MLPTVSFNIICTLINIDLFFLKIQLHSSILPQSSQWHYFVFGCRFKYLLFTPVWDSVCVCGQGCTCLCAYTHKWFCACMNAYVFVHLCVQYFVFVYIHVCMWACIQLYACMCLYVHICGLFVCVCVHMCVCVCVSRKPGLLFCVCRGLFWIPEVL